MGIERISLLNHEVVVGSRLPTYLPTSHYCHVTFHFVLFYSLLYDYKLLIGMQHSELFALRLLKPNHVIVACRGSLQTISNLVQNK
jgi:hypothetical protein